VLRDNDGNDPVELLKDLTEYLNDDRGVFIGASGQGNTLEPQIVRANDEKAVRTVLAITAKTVLGTWMDNNKTEGALRILESDVTLNAPSYITEAIAFVDEPAQ
jgi:hypothetical protein